VRPERNQLALHCSWFEKIGSFCHAHLDEHAFLDHGFQPAPNEPSEVERHSMIVLQQAGKAAEHLGKMPIELALPLGNCVLEEESIGLPKRNNSSAFTTK
jgi:hypothetical protein